MSQVRRLSKMFGWRHALSCWACKRCRWGTISVQRCPQHRGIARRVYR